MRAKLALCAIALAACGGDPSPTFDAPLDGDADALPIDALDGPPIDALDGPPIDSLDGPPPIDALDGPPPIDAIDAMPVPVTLTVVKNGTGAGTVTSNPAGIACGTDCSEDFLTGTPVTLVAAPAAGSIFAAWSGGGCTGAGACVVTVAAATTVTATFNTSTAQPNLVFVTSTLHFGNLGGLAGADGICQQRATAAGLAGTYRAWLSTSTENAIDRLGTASGWVRTDGRPFANSKADLAAGRVFYPINRDETGALRVGEYVWSSTTSTGVRTPPPDGGCTNWTSTSGTDIITGITDGGTRSWTSHFANTCNSSARLYCFGIDRQASVVPTPTAGRRIFVSTPWASGGGLTSADARCTADANAAGLAGTFRALLTTSQASASSRFDTAGTPWVRTDGVPLTTTAAAFFSAIRHDAVASVQADGVTYVESAPTAGPPHLWSGGLSMTLSSSLSQSCSDFTVNGAQTVRTGTLDSVIVSQMFGSSNTNLCSGSYRLLCLQL